MDRLLPCPHCGGAAERLSGGGFGSHFVWCMDCHASSDATSRSRAIAAWNRRSPETEALVEALEKLAAPAVRFDKTNSPNAWAEVLAMRDYASAALSLYRKKESQDG